MKNHHHVPEEVGEPVNKRTDTTDELQMFGLRHALLDEVEDKTCWDEGHGKDHANGHNGIHRRGQTV